jgi:predicted dehydrogenase
MMYKILVIGLGIGKLYQKILSKNSLYNVVTIDNDPYKEPDYLDLETCRTVNPQFDLAIICVPNYLHEEYVFKLHDYKMAKTVLVEKPGLGDFSSWITHVGMYAPNKLIMIKNNLYRDSYDAIIKTIKENVLDIKEVNIDWLNKNRIPNPGSWFTNKKLAFGGVSRDLMPHLLSIYYSLFGELNDPITSFKSQRHSLQSIEGTGYGTVDKKGVYDVDDYCRIEFRNEIKNVPIHVNLSASWKTDIPESKIGIEIVWRNKNKMFYEFGLCPEKAYLKMIEKTLSMTAVEYMNHNHIDAYIHNIIDNVD